MWETDNVIIFQGLTKVKLGIHLQDDCRIFIQTFHIKRKTLHLKHSDTIDFSFNYDNQYIITNSKLIELFYNETGNKSNYISNWLLLRLIQTN